MIRRITTLIFTILFLSTALYAQIVTLKVTPYGVSPRAAAVSTTDIYTYPYSGLTNVGVGTLMYFRGAITGQKFKTQTWTVTRRPSGSTASIGTVRDIQNDSTQVISITPDRPGTYAVTITDGSFTATVTFHAARYLGYLNTVVNAVDTKVNCNTCHESKVTDWGKTKHSTMMQRGVDGKVATYYSASCIPCHTTGHDINPTAKNDGFDDFSFTFPTVLAAGNYDKLVTSFPDAMKRANIQCEACHGPGSGHLGATTDSRMVDTYDVAVCAYCHDSGIYHYFPEQYRASLHGSPTTTPSGAGRESCVKCHTGKGFAQFADGVATTDPYFDPSYIPITCAACHDSHAVNNKYQLRKVTVSLLGLKGVYDPITTAGTGALCMNCHQSRREFNAQIAAAGYGSLNPHYGAQGDILYGRNMVEMGGIKLQSSGHSWLENTCVKCHMYKLNNVADAQGNIVQMGGHSFNMQTFKKDAKGNYILDPVTRKRIPDQENVESCAPCHGSTFGSFADVRFYMGGSGDFDNNGVVEGLQAEIKGMVAKIYDKMPKTSTGAVATPAATWTAAQLAGYWNAKTAEYDNSGGIHNPKYIVTALKGAMVALNIPTSIEADEQTIPTEYTLYQNYPNPFNPTTNIKFSLPKSSNVRLVIYDALGREVETLVNNELAAGTHTIKWSANNMATGIYLYKIEADNFVKVNKMLLIK